MRGSKCEKEKEKNHSKTKQRERLNHPLGIRKAITKMAERSTATTMRTTCQSLPG